MSGQTLGHWAKLNENLVNALETVSLTLAAGHFVRTNVFMISRQGLNMGHVRSELISIGQIEGNFC